MSTKTFVALGLLVSVVVSFGVVLQRETPAAADSIGDCSTSVGEIVVVDFSHWGGSIDRACDAKLTTGYTALYEAGFISEGTEEDGPGFICRIGLESEGSSSYEPTASEDPCVNTPPPTAYWSYWHADAGQNSWSYSQEGPMSYVPPPGSVDAWVFGATNISGTTGQPSFPPSAVRVTNTTPTPTTTTTTARSSSPTSTTSSTAPKSSSTSERGTSPPQSGPSGTTTTTVSSATTRPTTSGSTVPPHTGRGSSKPKPTDPASTAAPERTSPRILTIGPVSGRPPSSSAGSPALFAGGAGVVVVVVAAGSLTAWRRRHRSAP